jgi:hypothetical protein
VQYRFIVWVEADSRDEVLDKLFHLDEIVDYSWEREWDD